jgi:tRNA threonylcarbamoyladenosine modification (KEOPS) complex  Pcc1 subunit
MLKATITLRDNSAEIEKLFSFEEKEFQNERAKYETKLENGELKFIIEAKDSIALRSVLNTITKLLSVHEKTKDALKKW